MVYIGIPKRNAKDIHLSIYKVLKKRPLFQKNHFSVLNIGPRPELEKIHTCADLISIIILSIPDHAVGARAFGTIDKVLYRMAQKVIYI